MRDVQGRAEQSRAVESMMQAVQRERTKAKQKPIDRQKDRERERGSESESAITVHERAHALDEAVRSQWTRANGKWQLAKLQQQQQQQQR